MARLRTGDLGFARIDHHRAIRRGMPEVVFGEGKTDDQLSGIVKHMAERKVRILVTRIAPSAGVRLAQEHPAGTWNELARTFSVPRPGRQLKGERGLLVVSAGTADLPVAEEAVVTAEALGLAPDRLYDVGVAGIHRLFERQELLRKARVIVVVAGMEGALPSVVAGLVEAPVIGVPTSVGYGAAARGFTALFGMLTSCAGGMTVVNIDNGFGAACAARQILSVRRSSRRN
jgi:NCAIR mutase (PurE)-related protein